ncbi:hypothetical protein SAMN05443246_5799 [Paenibacillus sp. GP183]|jgi:hypothetical protein|nr:hypothetical protein SAMN05443246_5799 [Paenibacillus sp. GP183]
MGNLLFLISYSTTETIVETLKRYRETPLRCTNWQNCVITNDKLNENNM